MFFHLLSGLLRHEKNEEIIIHETSSVAMKKILYFMYHDTLDKSDIDCELLQTANKFLMEDLVDICIEHLKSNLNLENALDVLIVAYQIDQTSLRDAACQFISKNKGNLKTEKWTNMMRDHSQLIAKCLSHVYMGIS